MLNNDFFKVVKTTQIDKSIHSIIQLNKKHRIFDGHFPNNPVTPGVVQLQIVKEILEEVVRKKLLLKEMGRCKFLSILNPYNFSEILIAINYAIIENDIIKISALGTTLDKEQTFFKFTAKYL